MKRHLTITLAAFVTASCSLSAFAQSADEKPSKLSIVKTSAEDKAILEKTRESGPTAIPVPNFVVKSAGGGFYMTIGGQINTVIGCDLGNELYEISGAGGGFTTADIPLHPGKGHRSDFFINPLNTDLDFQVVGLAGTANELSGYIKIGTPGNVTGLKLKKAYLSWRGITVGQKETLFQDGDACQPPTIDSEGPCGEIAATVYGIGYKSPEWDGFSFAAGVEIPSFCNSNGIYRGKDYADWVGHSVTSDVNQNVPDIPVWLQYRFNENNRLRASFIFRDFRSLDLTTNRIRNTFGWGAQLSGNFSPAEPVTLYLQAVYGQGIGNYIQDLSGAPLAWIPKDDKPGYTSASPMMGLNFGVTYNINDKWQANALGSTTRIWKVRNYAEALPTDENYKGAIYAGANLFYNVTNYLQVGVEYLWGRRLTWGHGGANDSRIQAQVQLTL